MKCKHRCSLNIKRFRHVNTSIFQRLLCRFYLSPRTPLTCLNFRFILIDYIILAFTRNGPSNNAKCHMFSRPHCFHHQCLFHRYCWYMNETVHLSDPRYTDRGKEVNMEHHFEKPISWNMEVRNDKQRNNYWFY